MRTTSPSFRRSQSGSAHPVLLLFLAVLIFAAGLAVTWWYLTRRPAATTTSTPTPAPDFGPLTPGTPAFTPEPAASAEATVADAAPPAAEAVPPPPAKGGAKPPAPRRTAKPPVAGPVTQVPQILTQAEAAAAAKRFADAAELYDRALQLDPKNEAARAGIARIAAMGATRRFVLGTTVVESLRSVGRDLEGFDTAGIGVKRAPKVEGQIELVMQPAAVEPGRPYAVMVFLKNDGKKAIEVEEMKVSMIVDGKWSTRPLPPKVKQIRPKQRILLEELPGVWRAGVKDWAVEAVVTSKNQDVYRNRLTWK